MAAKDGCFGLSKVTGDLAKVESRINGQRGEWRGTGVGCGFRRGDQGRLPRGGLQEVSQGGVWGEASGGRQRDASRVASYVPYETWQSRSPKTPLPPLRLPAPLKLGGTTRPVRANKCERKCNVSLPGLAVKSPHVILWPFSS